MVEMLGEGEARFREDRRRARHGGREWHGVGRGKREAT